MISQYSALASSNLMHAIRSSSVNTFRLAAIVTTVNYVHFKSRSRRNAYKTKKFMPKSDKSLQLQYLFVEQVAKWRFFKILGLEIVVVSCVRHVVAQ